MKKITILVLVAMFALSACSSGKPSKDETVKAFLKKVEKSDAAKDASDEELAFVKKIIKCTLEEAYDDLNEKTLKYIVDEDVSIEEVDKKVTGKQNDILEKASTKCSAEISQ